MASVSVSVSVAYDHEVHHFELQRAVESTAPLTFPILCDTLVQHLRLPFTSAELVDVDNAPLEMLYVGDNGHYIPLDDDQALEDALAASSGVLELHLRPPRPPSTMDHTVDNTVVNENGDPPPPPPASKPRANTTILLRIYHHLHRHASSAAADALDQLSDTLDANPRDVTAIRGNRHQVTHLFASFLHHLHTRPQDYRITKGLHRQLVQRFDEISSDIDLSPDTTEAIHDAIRAVSHCHSSVTLIRNKYTKLMPDDVPPSPNSKTSDAPLTRASQEEDVSNPQSQSKNCSRHSRFRLPRRPLKYYFTRLDRMVAASSDNVKAFYARLVRYQTHLEKKGFEFPDWSVPLCRSIERTIFRVSRVHLVGADKGDELQIDSRAVQELGASVTRKLKRAGFPEKYAIRSGELTELMASDDGVVAAVASWSKKKLKRLAANVPVRMRYRGGNGVRGEVGSGSGNGATGEVRTAKGGGGNSSNGLKGGGDSLGSGKGSTRLSKDFSAGSGDIWRVSRVTDASGGSRRSWSHQDVAVRSGSPSRSNSRSRSHSLRSGDMGVGSAGAGGRSTSRGGGGSSSGHARRSHVGSHGSPKSLADDEFALRMELDPNPFGSPNVSNANISSERQRPLGRDRPPVIANVGDVNGGRGGGRNEKVPMRSNGGGASEGPGGLNAIPVKNAINKPAEKDLRENVLDEDDEDEDEDEDEDDIVDIEYDERLRRMFHRNFGDDIEFNDDKEDFDDEFVGGGGGSDDTRQSQWARVNMDKTKHRIPEDEGYTDDRVDDDVVYDVQSLHQQRQAMPTRPQRQAQRRGGYRLLSPSTSGPSRRERQTSPRPPHHDGYSVDLGAGAAAGATSGNGSFSYGRGGNAVGRVGSEVGGVSTHASETGTIGLATETGTATGRTVSMQRKLGLNGLDDTFEDDIDYQDDLDDDFDDTIIRNATYVLRNAAVSKANSIKHNGDVDGIHDDDADSFDTNETIHSDPHGGVGFGGVPLSTNPQQRRSGVSQVPAVAHGEYEPAGGLGLGFPHHHHQEQGQHQEQKRGSRHTAPSVQTLRTSSQWEPPNSESQWNGWVSHAYSDSGRNGPGVGDSITDASVGGRVASGVDAPLASSGGRPPVSNGNMSTSSNVRNLRPVRS